MCELIEKEIKAEKPKCETKIVIEFLYKLFKGMQPLWLVTKLRMSKPTIDESIYRLCLLYCFQP